jgi:anti-sigma B factor antagonist
LEAKVSTFGDGVTLAVISGEVDACTAPELEGTLLALVEKPHNRIVADLSGVSFLSSSGLRVLFRAHSLEEKRGGTLTLCAVRPSVSKVLELSGFDKLFRIAPGRDEALGP